MFSYLIKINILYIISYFIIYFFSNIILSSARLSRRRNCNHFIFCVFFFSHKDRANYFFLGLFSFEMILKIYCLGFNGYCLSLFNRFDGLVRIRLFFFLDVFVFSMFHFQPSTLVNNGKSKNIFNNLKNHFSFVFTKRSVYIYMTKKKSLKSLLNGFFLLRLLFDHLKFVENL